MNFNNNLSDYMKSKSCRCCNGLVKNPSTYGYCPKCEKQITDAYYLVKNYLSHSPGTTLADLRKELNLPFKILHLLMEDGRISLHER
ncbi:MAG: hypothetical protein AB2421_02975 [Thermotaleaceae bacterium]